MFCTLLTYVSFFRYFVVKAKTLTTHMTILELQYADDNALVSHTEEDLQAAVVAFGYAYVALGLTLNVRKTQVLFQPSPDHTQGRKQPEEDQRLSSVDHFTYIACVVACHARQIWMFKLKLV